MNEKLFEFIKEVEKRFKKKYAIREISLVFRKDDEGDFLEVKIQTDYFSYKATDILVNYFGLEKSLEAVETELKTAFFMFTPENPP